MVRHGLEVLGKPESLGAVPRAAVRASATDYKVCRQACCSLRLQPKKLDLSHSLEASSNTSYYRAVKGCWPCLENFKCNVAARTRCPFRGARSACYAIYCRLTSALLVSRIQERAAAELTAVLATPAGDCRVHIKTSAYQAHEPSRDSHVIKVPRFNRNLLGVR